MGSKDVHFNWIAANSHREQIRAMTNSLEPETLPQLIISRKRGRSYETMASQSDGTLSRSNIQRMVTADLQEIPGVKVIRALAKVLGVSESRVFSAAGASIGLSASATGDLVIDGGAYLPVESQQVLKDMAENMRWWSEQVARESDERTKALDKVKDFERAAEVAKEEATFAADTIDYQQEQIRKLEDELKLLKKSGYGLAADSSAQDRAEGPIDPERPVDSV